MYSHHPICCPVPHSCGDAHEAGILPIGVVAFVVVDVQADAEGLAGLDGGLLRDECEVDSRVLGICLGGRGEERGKEQKAGEGRHGIKGA